MDMEARLHSRASLAMLGGKGDGTERQTAITIDAFSPQHSKIKLFLPIKVTPI